MSGDAWDNRVPAAVGRGLRRPHRAHPLRRRLPHRVVSTVQCSLKVVHELSQGISSDFCHLPSSHISSISKVKNLSYELN